MQLHQSQRPGRRYGMLHSSLFWSCFFLVALELILNRHARQNGSGSCTLLCEGKNKTLQCYKNAWTWHCATWEHCSQRSLAQSWPLPSTDPHGAAQHRHLRLHIFAATPEGFGELFNDLIPVLNRYENSIDM